MLAASRCCLLFQWRTFTAANDTSVGLKFRLDGGNQSSFFVCARIRRPCYTAFVQMLWTIRRFLAAFAILGLILAPIAQPAMAMPSDSAGASIHQEMHGSMATDTSMAMPDSMPCCPSQAPMSDCGKHCLMVMCGAMVFPVLPATTAMAVADSTRLSVGTTAALRGLSVTPPPRPPRF